MRRITLACAACVGLGLAAAAAMTSEIEIGDPEIHLSLAEAPTDQGARENPLASDPNAARAGGKLYARHCASCHGADLQGTRRAPGLRTEAVGQASAGEIEWFLRNGRMRTGMPSWSGLPEARRWQIVSFLQSKR